MAVNLGDIQQIQEHLEADGVDVENVLSDIEELGQRDPTFFTGPNGEDARLYLDDAAQQIAAGLKNEAAGSLDKALGLLEAKLRGDDEGLRVPGGKRRRRKTKKSRRGRKSRRKSLRQRK